MEEKKEKVILLVKTGTMESVISALNIAIASRAMGKEVTIFFTFWGLLLLKSSSAKTRGLLMHLLHLFAGIRYGKAPLGFLNLCGLGRIIMERLMKKKGLLSWDILLRTAHSEGVKILACSTTLELMGLRKDDLIPEVDAISGAAGFIDEMEKGRVLVF